MSLGYYRALMNLTRPIRLTDVYPTNLEILYAFKDIGVSGIECGEYYRDSDGTTHTTQWNNRGELDETHMLSIAGSGDLWIRRNDLSGNGYDEAWASTKTDNFKIVESGVISKDSTGRIALKIGGSTIIDISGVGTAFNSFTAHTFFLRKTYLVASPATNNTLLNERYAFQMNNTAFSKLYIVPSQFDFSPTNNSTEGIYWLDTSGATSDRRSGYANTTYTFSANDNINDVVISTTSSNAIYKDQVDQGTFDYFRGGFTQASNRTINDFSFSGSPDVRLRTSTNVLAQGFCMYSSNQTSYISAIEDILYQ